MSKYDHLHLVQSIDSLTGGGLTTSCEQLVMAQKGLGLKSDFVSSTSNKAYETKMILARKDHLNPILYTQGMKQLLLGTEASMIHSHGLYMYTSYLSTLYAKRFDTSMMVHVHGMFEPWILSRSGWKKMIANLIFENFKYKKANFWRALTSKEVDQIRNYGVKGKIIEIPNGIDLAPIDHFLLENRVVQKKGSNTILFLGRLHEKKGIKEFLKAFLSVSKAIRNSWKLKIVGPDEGMLNTLKKIAGDENGVEFLGPVYGEEKFDILNSADLFVLPSFSEGFSMAVLEAMAFSKPVLITDACNFNKAYDYGALKLSDDITMWGKELVSVMSRSTAELLDIGNTLRKLVKDQYQWIEIARELEEIIANE